VTLRIGLALLALAVAGAPRAQAQAAGKPGAGDVFPYRVHETTLDNGLEVVVIPYDSPGTIAYFSVVRTGARDEVEPGRTGFAHFFEHMMFRGTEKYSEEAYNDLLKRMGADFNAFTSSDYTNYYLTGPASQLETLMEVESDRFKNLKYGEEQFRKEALAVLGEYNKSVSNPVLPMIEKLYGLAFQKHTYRHLTIGFLEDIKAMPTGYQYSLQFLDRFYRPENITLLVVGDVQPQRVVELARKYYGDWKKGYKPVEIAAEPPQTEPKKGHLDWPNPIPPHLLLGYHVPAFSTSTVDTAALAVISQLLFSESAPLYQQLVVDKQWVDSLSGGAQEQRDPNLFIVLARIKKEELVPQVRQAIAAEVEKLQKEPVDPKRLDRVKSYLRYNFALGLTSPSAVGFAAASAISLTGEVSDLNKSFEQYQKVTPADVQRVAREIFRPANETTVTLSYAAPKVDGQTAPGAQPGAGEGR
jgi:zinc protease